MRKVFNIFAIFVMLNGCSKEDLSNEGKISSLILPDFTYTQDLFDCDLNKNQTLIGLESFFSKNIEEYKVIANLESLKISVLFPDKSTNITNFIISIVSDNNRIGLMRIVDAINNDSFREVASCSFEIFQHKGINFKEEFVTNTNSFTNAEILRCKFNDGYNFGTFKISIDRFVNNLKLRDLPYSVSYLEDSSLDNNFIWINYFYQEDYQDFLLKNWINDKDSAEIQNEFAENAICIETNKYKSYKLI
jgi:hypothetical protein